MKPLVLVESQNDLLSGGVLAVPEGHEVIPVANELRSAFLLVVLAHGFRRLVPPYHP